MRRELKAFSGQCPIQINGELTVKQNKVIKISYELIGKLEEVLFTEEQVGKRRHELWTQTCFEAFFFKENQSYVEWNFNNQGSWQAYQFNAYREPSPPSEFITPSPKIEFEGNKIDIEIPELEFQSFNLTSVIKLKTGQSFYFAIVHADGAADFHQRQASLERGLALI